MSLMRCAAVIARRHGGPEVLEWAPDVEVPPPAAGEVRIVQQAIGLNYADIYQRKGRTGSARQHALSGGARLAGRRRDRKPRRWRDRASRSARR